MFIELSGKEKKISTISIYKSFFTSWPQHTRSVWLEGMAYKWDNGRFMEIMSLTSWLMPGIDAGELVVLFSTLLSPVDKWFQMEIIHPLLLLPLPAGRGNFQTIKSDRTHYKWSSAIRQSCCSSIERSSLSYVDNQIPDRTTICNVDNIPIPIH